MRLMFSNSGTPYIEIDEETRLIFSKLTDDDTYYKWIAVRAIEILNGSVGKGRRRRNYSKTTVINFMTDFKLRGFPRGFLKKNQAFSKVKHGLLKKLFKKYCVEDPNDSDMLILTNDKLPILEAELERIYTDEDD